MEMLEKMQVLETVFGLRLFLWVLNKLHASFERFRQPVSMLKVAYFIPLRSWENYGKLTAIVNVWKKYSFRVCHGEKK